VKKTGLPNQSALIWFRSYLSGRTYRVVYAGGTSSVVYIVCSVPQGSVLGPVLFVLYMADLADIVNRHNVTLHSFADDTQLYLHCCREDITTAATRLKECIVDVGRWMSANRLKLNMDKIELLWTGSRHSISQLHGHGPSMCPSSVQRTSTGYDSFDEFADHSTTNRQPYWFTPLLRPGSTIAICCWLEHQSLLLTSCSGS